MLEGHVNRLKFLKRQMFGRAGLGFFRIPDESFTNFATEPFRS